ncbi:MAG: putative motility protein [Thiobacillus sp.]|nr:putative motility protein [Thiobacillus sp.]
MEGISAALASNQAMTQSQIGLAAMKMAMQAEQQVVAMLAQAAQAGQSLASNPAHLGQSLDIYA